MTSIVSPAQMDVVPSRGGGVLGTEKRPDSQEEEEEEEELWDWLQWC